jgi:tRNA(adenine34) deaminase
LPIDTTTARRKPMRSAASAAGPSRRGALAALFAAATLPALAPASARAAAVAGAVRPEDEGFMRIALEEAALAEFPFGAAIVVDGALQAKGHNLGRGDPTAHGEMTAIRTFIAEKGPAGLKGATLYTSGEPCSMCMSAIVWCGIGRVVYAASIAELSTVIGQIQIPSAEVAERTPFATVEITGGVLADEAMALFRK